MSLATTLPPPDLEDEDFRIILDLQDMTIVYADGHFRARLRKPHPATVHALSMVGVHGFLVEEVLDAGGGSLELTLRGPRVREAL